MSSKTITHTLEMIEISTCFWSCGRFALANDPFLPCLEMCLSKCALDLLYSALHPFKIPQTQELVPIAKVPVS